MKTIIFFSTLFLLITLPALGALTDADLDKIRLIVKEEVKAESTAVKQELKDDIAKSEQSVKEQITLLTYFVYALIALIVAAIAIPQIIMLWRSEESDPLQEKLKSSHRK